VVAAEIETRKSSLIWASLLGLWLGVIYVGIFFARAGQRLVEQTVGRDAFTVFVLGVLTIVTVWAIKHLKGLSDRLSLVDYLVFALVVSVLAVRTLQLGANAPEEAVHLVQYGMVYFLSLKVLLSLSNNILMLPLALIITIFFGTLDEVIQWLAPERFFDWRDIALNAFSGAMIFIVFCFPLRPENLRYKIERRPLLGLLLSSAALSSLIVFCLINTPQNLSSLRRTMPQFFELFPHVGEMTEYGYSYQGEGLSKFQSRLNAEQLEKTDLGIGKDFAKTVRSLNHLSYPEKLARFYPAEYPWQHEVLVRLSRLENAVVRNDQQVTIREREIFKNYFPNFFKSYFKTRHPVNQKYLAEQDSSNQYVSEVSKHLITLFSREDVKTFYLGFSLVLTLALFMIIFRFV